MADRIAKARFTEAANVPKTIRAPNVLASEHLWGFPAALLCAMMPNMGGHEYPSFVAGLRYCGRGKYCADHVHPGDLLILRVEPDNPHDHRAVSIRPANDSNVVIGYVPRKHAWIERAIRDGYRIDAVVKVVSSTHRLFGWFRRAWRVWITVRVSSAPAHSHARTVGQAAGTQHRKVRQAG